MSKPSFKTSTVIVLSSLLALGSSACNSLSINNPFNTTADAPATVSPSPAVSPSPKATPVANVSTAKATASTAKASTTLNTAAKQSTPTKSKLTPQAKKSTPPQPQANKPDTYPQAIDAATGAITISRSAVSREDWSLVATQWQQAINLLKQVPNSSKNYATAQQKVRQYQGFMADAKVRATPPPKRTIEGDITPQFFSIPIKGRAGGTPIVEVTFNGSRKFDMLFDTGATGTLITREIAYTLRLKPTGTAQVGIADGSVVEVIVAKLNSIEIDGRIKKNVEVWVAPPAMPIGLLGQDFFEGYDVSIKENAIEFRKR